MVPLLLPASLAWVSAWCWSAVAVGSIAPPRFVCPPELLIAALLTLALAPGRLRWPSVLLAVLLLPWAQDLPKSPLERELRHSGYARLLERPRCSLNCRALVSLDEGPVKTVELRWQDPMGLNKGDWVLAQGRLSPLLPGRLPGATPSLQRRRGAQGIWRLGRPDSGHLIRISDPVLSAHQRWVSHIRSLAPQRSRDVFSAMLAGERGPPSALSQSFVDAGTAHLLAISGLHVGGMALLLAALLAMPLRRWRHPRRSWDPAALAPALGLAAALAFASLAGLPSSSVRALIFVALATLASWTHRPFSLWNALSLAVLLTAALSPANATRPGFVLAVTAVAAIAWALGAGPAKEGRLASSLRISTAAFLGTAPVVVATFGILPLASVPANAVAVPLVSILVLPLAALAALASLLHPALAALWSVPDALLGAVQAFSRPLLKVLPPLHLGLSARGMLLLYAALLLLGLLLFPAGAPLGGRLRQLGWKRRCLGALLFVPLLLPLGKHEARPVDDGLVLTALDVGHGDALLLSLPEGGYVLVDGGPAYGARSVERALRALGVRRLRFLVLTHVDADHAGAADVLLDAFPVDEVILPARTGAGMGRSFSAAVLAHTHSFWRAGMEVSWDGQTTVRVLAPNGGSSPSSNGRSLVLRVQGPRLSLLLTGDVDGEGERALLEQERGRLPVSVLKLSHHASAASSLPEFLEAVDPKLALATTDGRRFPSLRVQEDLLRLGIPHLFTHQEGSVQVWATDTALWLRSYRGRWSAGLRLGPRSDPAPPKSPHLASSAPGRLPEP